MSQPSRADFVYRIGAVAFKRSSRASGQGLSRFSYRVRPSNGGADGPSRHPYLACDRRCRRLASRLIYQRRWLWADWRHRRRHHWLRHRRPSAATDRNPSRCWLHSLSQSLYRRVPAADDCALSQALKDCAWVGNDLSAPVRVDIGPVSQQGRQATGRAQASCRGPWFRCDRGLASACRSGYGPSLAASTPSRSREYAVTWERILQERP